MTSKNNNLEAVSNFFRHQITLLRQMGKTGTAATYQQPLNSIIRFRQGKDILFKAVIQEFTLAYLSGFNPNITHRPGKT